MTEYDDLMPIGMFSRATLLSVKALRSYHELGLLVPTRIDPGTGYRSYAVSQLPDAEAIRRLRDLDVPLADIATITTSRDPERTREVLDRHEERLRDRLAQTRAALDELDTARRTPGLQTPIHTRTEPGTPALTLSAQVRQTDYAAWLDEAYPRLFATAVTLGVTPTGAPGALYPPLVEDRPQEVVAFLPAPVAPGPVPADEDVLARELPPARVAVVVHAGAYDDIGRSYRALGAWVATHARSAGEPIREHYVVSIDPATGGLLPPESLRTEIAWPITTEGDPS